MVKKYEPRQIFNCQVAEEQRNYPKTDTIIYFYKKS